MFKYEKLNDRFQLSYANTMSDFDLHKERRTGIDFGKANKELTKEETTYSSIDNVSIEALEPGYLK